MNRKVVVPTRTSVRASGRVTVISIRRLAMLVAACAVLGASSALAGTFAYTPTEATNTSASPDNWSAGPAAGWDVTPASASDTTLVFNGPATAVNRFTANDVANPFQLNVLTLQGTGVASGTGALTLQGNPLQLISNGATTPVVNLNASIGTGGVYGFTVGNGLTLSNNTAFTGAGNASFVFSGVIGGAGSLTKSGGSVLTLGGTAANTYSGGTTVSAGEIDLNKTSATNSIPGNLSITGGTVKLLQTSQIADAAAVTLSGSGTLNFNGKGDTIASLSLAGSSIINNTQGPITITGTLTNTSTSTGGSGAALVVNSGGNITVNGLANFGAGAQTLMGGGNNTRLNFNGGLSLTDATIRMNTGTDSKIVLSSDVTVNDPGNATSSAIGSGAIANGLDLNGGSRTFTVANGSAAVDFSVAALVANGSLAKTGAGTMALGNSGNSYAGGTTITGGSVAAQANGAFGTGPVTLSPGTSIDLSSANVTTGAIDDGATLSLSSSGGTNFSNVLFGTNTLAETVGSLVLDGVSQSPGTYTSANLGNYILGSGSIVVAPEPASAGLLMLAAAGLLVRRRRR